MSLGEQIDSYFAQFTSNLREFGDATVEIDKELIPEGYFKWAVQYWLIRIVSISNSERYHRLMKSSCPNATQSYGDVHFCDSCDWMEITIIDKEMSFV